MIELKDTAELMSSNDFRERFVAEYLQTKIRYDRLRKMIVKYEAGTLPFTPKNSLELFKKQASAMGNYLYCLEVRAQNEGIELGD